jgi:uncharacterized protein YoxC
VLPLAFAWSDVAYLALSVFLVAVGLSLAFAFLRLGGTLGRVSAFIRGAESEILPLIGKIGGTVDRVNGQLDKVDQMTDSAVDAVQGVDSAVRAVSFAVTRPVRKISGVAAGLSYGASELRASRDWRSAVAAAKAAAARRERELDEELREAGTGPPTP